MLPDIDSKQGNETGGGLQRILIGQRSQLQFVCLLVVAQPAPARTLHGYGERTKLLLELIEALPLRLDGVLQIFAGRRLVGREILPEDSVIYVATAIESQSRRQLNNFGGVALALGILQLLLGGIQIVDIGLVMLLMMQLHNLTVNNRLQCGIIVGQLRQCMLAPQADGAADLIINMYIYIKL